MSKIIDAPVLLITEKEKPRRFFWFKRWVNVFRVIDEWRETGRWWEDDKEKSFFRVLSLEGSIYEVYNQDKQWNLYKVYD
ncbi:MAG: DUF6504 family protein [Bacillota bacterium]|jgi:hypothetical protein|nr:hypothetical protein [Candidatus Fermentithermobacillaceae bacterium]